MRLALHIIAKDEIQQLKRIINDYQQYFDEIAIAIDTDINETFDSKVKIHRYKWIDDFADKRNFLASKTESEYYLRLDTDDVIENPENIRKVFEDTVKGKVDVVNVPYIYSVDQDGNCDAKHWRETIIKKSDNHYWKKPIHENIFVEDQSKFKGVKDNRIKIIHKTEPGHAEKSAERNFKLLLKEFDKDKEKTDPRTIAYIGRMLMGYGQWQKAIPFLEMLIRASGWDDDKYFAWVHLAQCHFQLRKLDTAIAACNEALGINPEFPDAYLSLCEIYIAKNEYDKAVHWGNIGIRKPEPKTMVVLDPSTYGYKAIMNLAIAYFYQGDYQKAKICYDKAYKLSPNNEFIKSKKSLFETAFENSEYFNRLAWMVSYTKDRDPSKLQDLVKSIPSNMLEDERIHSLRHSILDAKEVTGVSIYCGRSWEEWSPASVIKGIGGSEEAVIYLSKELAKLGNKVTVFNSCGDMAGEYEGVTYKPYYEFNPGDIYETVIAWRGNIFKGDIQADRKYIWMHDVPQPDQFGEGDDFDKIIVLSEFHKSLLPDSIPKEKIFVSSNGINLKDFNKTGVERNPKRMIHTSSYDRGIQHLLLNWKKVKKEVPDAELHLFYGWETYDRMVEQGFRDPSFKEQMVKLMDQPGVMDHGRVGHKKLVKEFLKSGLFVYPSHFEEISCISAMKAQACGCVPVTTDYAALKETVKEGLFVKGSAQDKEVTEKYIDTLIGILKDTDLQEKYRKEVSSHKEEFSWANVARQWNDSLFR